MTSETKKRRLDVWAVKIALRSDRLMRKGQHQRALRLVQRALASTKDPRIYSYLLELLARVLHAMERYSDVLSVLHEVHSRKPLDARPLLTVADLLKELGCPYDTVLAAYRSALRLAPVPSWDRHLAHLSIGELALDHGNAALAARHLLLAMRAKPMDAEFPFISLALDLVRAGHAKREATIYFRWVCRGMERGFWMPTWHYENELLDELAWLLAGEP